MYELLREDSAVSISLRGRLEDAELAETAEQLKKGCDEHGHVQVLVELEEASEEDALYVLKRLADHLSERRDRVQKLGVVGGEWTDQRRTRLHAAFPAAQVQTHSPAHLAEAWAWVRGKR